MPEMQEPEGFDPWAWKIPWSRKWQPTPVFLPGKPHGQKSLVGYNPWSGKVRYDWVTNRAYTHTPTHTHTYKKTQTKPETCFLATGSPLQTSQHTHTHTHTHTTRKPKPNQKHASLTHTHTLQKNPNQTRNMLLATGSPLEPLGQLQRRVGLLGPRPAFSLGWWTLPGALLFFFC